MDGPGQVTDAPGPAASRRYRGIFDFSDEVDTDRLRSVTRWLLEAMVQEHLTALRTVIHQSRTVLEPVLPSPRGENADSKSGTGTEAPGTWANQVLSLLLQLCSLLTQCVLQRIKSKLVQVLLQYYELVAQEVKSST